MKRKRFMVLVVAMMIIMAVLPGRTITVQAKTPRNGKTRDAQGDIYIYKHGKLQTGWFTYHGKRYYAHKTKSASYKVGSVTRNAYRIDKNGKWYYFGSTGAMQTKDSHYIDIRSRDKSVRGIKIPGTGGKCRYNTARQRYQEKVGGKWHDVGMQCLPYGLIDHQW